MKKILSNNRLEGILIFPILYHLLVILTPSKLFSEEKVNKSSKKSVVEFECFKYKRQLHKNKINLITGARYFNLAWYKE